MRLFYSAGDPTTGLCINACMANSSTVSVHIMYANRRNGRALIPPLGGHLVSKDIPKDQPGRAGFSHQRFTSPPRDPNRWGKAMVDAITEKLGQPATVSAESARVKGSGNRGSKPSQT